MPGGSIGGFPELVLIAAAAHCEFCILEAFLQRRFFDFDNFSVKFYSGMMLFIDHDNIFCCCFLGILNPTIRYTSRRGR